MGQEEPLQSPLDDRFSSFAGTSEKQAKDIPEGKTGPHKRGQKTKTPVGDYGEDGNTLWNEYMKEAESHDQALMESWKDELESTIIFAGLYSASLTAFLVESYQNLQADPTNQTMQFANQSVVLLSQISRQLGPNGGQVTLSFPDPQSVSFPGPTASDVRINIYWFISLVLSLSTVLFASIVQQWVRDYNSCVFPGHIPTLDRARIRQLLYEDSLRRMSVTVEAVAVLVHISLFLFFAGLVEFLFGINSSVAIWTTIIIAISALLYLTTTFAPILNRQLSYQSPATSVFWYVVQTVLLGRRGKGRSGEGVRTNLAQDRVQIAMLESDERKMRDVRAIRWIIDNLTEDSELQSFIAGIPGSLNSQWGKDVWRTIMEEEQDEQMATEDQEARKFVVDSLRTDFSTAELDPSGRDDAEDELPGPPHAPHQPRHPRRLFAGPLRFITKRFKHLLRATWYTTRQLFTRRLARKSEDRVAIVGDLSRRITRMLKSCTEYGILSSDDRKKRARACIDAALQLVLSLQAKWQWFSEREVICRTLVYLGQSEKDKHGASGKAQVLDPAFAARRACMAVVVVRHIIQDDLVKDSAKTVIDRLAAAQPGEEVYARERADKVARLIDDGVKRAWSAAKDIQEALNKTSRDRDQSSSQGDNVFSKTAIRSFEKLDDARYALEQWARPTSNALADLTEALHKSTAGVLEYLPGALISWLPSIAQGHQLPDVILSPRFLPQLIPPLHLVGRLWLSTWMARNINTHGWTWSTLKDPKELIAPELSMQQIKKVMDSPGTPFRTQLWRAVDIYEGGMVFTLELLVNAIRSPGLPHTEASRKLFIETFNLITREWRNYNSLGTQKLLVALLMEVVPPANVGSTHEDHGLPLPLVDEFVILSGKMLQGKVEKGTHTAEALETLGPYWARAHTLEEPDVRRSATLEAILRLFHSAIQFRELRNVDSSWELFTETLEAISREWDARVVLTDTMQEWLLTLLQDILPRPDTTRWRRYQWLPLPLTNELVKLAGKALKGAMEEETHVGKALKVLHSYWDYTRTSGDRDAHWSAVALEATLDLLANGVNAMRSSTLPDTKPSTDILIPLLTSITPELELCNTFNTQKPLVALLREAVLAVDVVLSLGDVHALIKLAGTTLKGQAGMGTHVAEALDVLRGHKHVHKTRNLLNMGSTETRSVPCPFAQNAIRNIESAPVRLESRASV